MSECPEAMGSAEEATLETKLLELGGEVRECWGQIKQSASDGFGLGSEVIVIGQTDEVFLSSLTALPSQIRVSSAFSHPLIVKFRELEKTVGMEQAWMNLANDDEEGELFCELWDECSAEQAAGVKLTTDDLVEIAVAVKEGQKSDPPNAVVLWDRPGDGFLWGYVSYTA